MVCVSKPTRETDLLKLSLVVGCLHELEFVSFPLQGSRYVRYVQVFRARGFWWQPFAQLWPPSISFHSISATMFNWFQGCADYSSRQLNSLAMLESHFSGGTPRAPAPSHPAPSGTDSMPHLCHSGFQRHSGDTTPLQIASRHLTKKCPMIDLRMRGVTTSVVLGKNLGKEESRESSSQLRMKKQTVWEHQPIFTGEKYLILSILFVGESPLWSWDNHCCWYIIIPHFCWLNPSKSSFGNSIPYKSESSRTWKTCLQKLLCRCPCIYIYIHHRYTNTSRHYELYCSMMSMIKQTQVHTL